MWNEVILQDATMLIEMGGPDDLAAALALNESDYALARYQNCSFCAECNQCGGFDAFSRVNCQGCSLCQVDPFTQVMICANCASCFNQIYLDCLTC